MKINGMGNVSKKEIGTILTRGYLRDIKDGDLTWEEAASMYKLEAVKKICPIGDTQQTFWANYNRIPDEIADKLSPQEISDLVMAFYKAYGDGKAEGRREISK